MPGSKPGVRRGGRQKGVPNKVTADVRATIALIAAKNVGKVQQWLEEIEDPAKRVGLFLDLCEYHIPKLARTELTGKDGGPVIIQSTPTDEAL